MDMAAIALALAILDTCCWGVCFWWMHRISQRQDEMLKKLSEQARRIEILSHEEHELIKEVHPQVSQIKEHVQEVKEAVQS